MKPKLKPKPGKIDMAAEMFIAVDVLFLGLDL